MANGQTRRERRATDATGFRSVYGRAPDSALDQRMAEMLAPDCPAPKNQGIRAEILVKRVNPIPGLGLVRAGIFIPQEAVWAMFGAAHLGDGRGFDQQFDPAETRVAFFLDFEHGRVAVRQNPAVSASGEAAVRPPSVRVRQNAEGRVHIRYDAKNPLLWSGFRESVWSIWGTLAFGRACGAGVAVTGRVGRYPAIEIYHDIPDGAGATTTRIVHQHRGTAAGAYSPALGLPLRRGISAMSNTPYPQQPLI